MRRWLITALLVCVLGTSLFGQDAAPRPQLAVATPRASHPPQNASLVNETAPTLVATTPVFPSLSPETKETLQAESTPSRTGLAGPTVTVTSSLAVVLGLFAGLVWITRKFGSRSIGNGTLPRDVLQSLGSAAIDPRTRVTMLRCGGRILVVAQTQAGIQPLSEITDREEVQRLTAACRADSKHSFTSTVRSLEKEPVEPGFVGAADEPPRPRRRLFATA